MKKISVKRIFSLLLLSFIFTFGYSQQRILTWSVGEVQIQCATGTSPAKLIYPIQVEINNTADDVRMADATIRFFYDAGGLGSMTVTDVIPNYVANIVSISTDVYGQAFGFTSNVPPAKTGGKYVTIDFRAPNSAKAMSLSQKITLFNVVLEMDSALTYPLIRSFVFDSDHTSLTDRGYSSEGIAGSYFLNLSDLRELSGDQVINYLWKTNSGYAAPLTAGDLVGTSLTTGGIEDPTVNLTVTSPSAVCSNETVDLTVGAVTSGTTPSTVSLTYWIDEAGTQVLSNPEAITQSGVYYIKASSNSTCYETKSVTVTINQTPEKPIIQVIDATCTSSATVTITNYDSSVTYNFSGGLTHSGGSVSGFSLGSTYSVTVSKDGCTSSPTVFELTDNKGVDVNLHVYLEGALVDVNTGNVPVSGPYVMRTTLNRLGLLPGQVHKDDFQGNTYIPVLGTSGQGYNVSPWNYSGTEGSNYDSGGDVAKASAGYASTVVDWVLVSFRTEATNKNEYLHRQAALLHNDGRVEFIGGSCVGLDETKSYYVIIEHRNHLMVMSADKVNIVNNKFTYDFRAQQSYIYDEFAPQNFTGQIQLSSGVYAMAAGNGDQQSSGTADTDINAGDVSLFRTKTGTSNAYNPADFNLSGDINTNDIRLLRNSGKATSVKRD